MIEDTSCKVAIYCLVNAGGLSCRKHESVRSKSLKDVQGRWNDIIMVIETMIIVPIETVGRDLAPHVFVASIIMAEHYYLGSTYTRHHLYL